MFLHRFNGELHSLGDLRMTQPFLFMQSVYTLLLLRELGDRFIQHRMIILARRLSVYCRLDFQLGLPATFPRHIPDVVEHMISRCGKKIGVKIRNLRQARSLYPNLYKYILHDLLGGRPRFGEPVYVGAQPLVVGVKQLAESSLITFRDTAQQRPFLI